MFKMFKITVVFTFVLSFCYGQVLKFGTCPSVETKKYFELEKFLGHWYEIKRFPIWYEGYGQCAYKSFQACGRRIEIEHGFVKDGIQYHLHVNTTYAPGDEAVFGIQENSIDPVGIPLKIISTDYTNYAVVYGCKSAEKLHIKYTAAWVLSRTVTLEENVLKRVLREFSEITSDSAIYFENVHHHEEACSYHWTANIEATYH